jgi:hypothetical protein
VLWLVFLSYVQEFLNQIIRSSEMLRQYHKMYPYHFLLVNNDPLQNCMGEVVGGLAK